MEYYDILSEENAAVQKIAEDKRQGKLSHCYIIETGSEKDIKPILMTVATKILCKSGGCGICGICSAIEHGNMYDLMILEDKIDVKTIGDLVNDTYVKPLIEGGVKVYLIVGGEKITPQLQNKLLKTLEEPINNICIIIGTANEGRLLATVKSRAVKLSSKSIDADVLKKYLTAKHKGASAELVEIAIGVSGGSLALSDEIIKDGVCLSVYERVLEILGSMLKSSDVMNYTGDKIFSENLLSTTLSVMEMVFEEIILFINNVNSVKVRAKTAEYEKLAARYSSASLINAIRAVADTKQKIESNCAKYALVDKLLLTILEVRYKCSK